MRETPHGNTKKKLPGEGHSCRADDSSEHLTFKFREKMRSACKSTMKNGENCGSALGKNFCLHRQTTEGKVSAELHSR